MKTKTLVELWKCLQHDDYTDIFYIVRQFPELTFETVKELIKLGEMKNNKKAFELYTGIKIKD